MSSKDSSKDTLKNSNKQTDNVHKPKDSLNKKSTKAHPPEAARTVNTTAKQWVDYGVQSRLDGKSKNGKSK